MESENNLGEILSSEFIAMIEKREKKITNAEIELENTANDNNFADTEKYDSRSFVENHDVSTNFTNITRLNDEENNDEYVVMLAKNSFEPANDPEDCGDEALNQAANYGGIDNCNDHALEEVDDADSCIYTEHFSTEDAQHMHKDEESSSDEDDSKSVLTAEPASQSQDPIEIRDNCSSHADDLVENTTDDVTDTVRDNLGRNDDVEKTLDCGDDDTTEKSDTKTLETNESTTSNDQEQRINSHKTENLIPLKAMQSLPANNFEQLYLNNSVYRYIHINSQGKHFVSIL